MFLLFMETNWLVINETESAWVYFYDAEVGGGEVG